MLNQPANALDQLELGDIGSLPSRTLFFSASSFVILHSTAMYHSSDVSACDPAPGRLSSSIVVDTPEYPHESIQIRRVFRPSVAQIVVALQ